MKILNSLLLLTLLCGSIIAQDKPAEEKSKPEMKPVLIVIDTQNEFMPYMDDADKKLGLDMINWAIFTFRSMGLPIISVYHTNPEYGPDQAGEGFQFDPKIKITDDDLKVVKNYPSAFKKTNLDEMIKKLGGNTLFLCGLSAVGCVIATYHGAVDLDYDVLLLEGALLSHDTKQTKQIEGIFKSVDFDVMSMMLKYASK